jgi:plasmid replication initiation protein
LIPRLDGVILSKERKEAPWDKFVTGAPRPRTPSERRYIERKDGRMQEIEVEPSDWVFEAINNYEVLTLDCDYFRLRKPIERRLYEIARKHCGAQKSWKIGLAKLK